MQSENRMQNVLLLPGLSITSNRSRLGCFLPRGCPGHVWRKKGGVRGCWGAEDLVQWQLCSEEELEVVSTWGKRWHLLLLAVWLLCGSPRPSFSLS